MTETLLVTGASGQLGRRVLHHLIETSKVPLEQIVATTRNPEKLSDLATRGVTVRHADFDDPASLADAFKGAQRVLVISTNMLDLGGGRLKQHETAFAAAKAAGASHLLYTSMPNPEPGSPVLFASDHHGSEEAIKASGLAYTVFRNGWYQENLLMSLPMALATGRWHTSAGDGRIAYGARDDIAAAIAARLASDSSDSTIFTLTGPEAHSVEEIAALTSDLTGRPIEVVHLSDEALTEALVASGVPQDFARLFVSFDANTRAGRIDMVTDTIETLSGRRPKSLKHFLEVNEAALLA